MSGDQLGTLLSCLINYNSFLLTWNSNLLVNYFGVPKVMLEFFMYEKNVPVKFIKSEIQIQEGCCQNSLENIK